MMTMPPEEREVVCPKCGAEYQDWYRYIGSLGEFDDKYRDECVSAICPFCKHKTYFGGDDDLDDDANDSELCVNVWYCCSKKTGFINALAGRGYFLSGTYDEKMVILKSLSMSDYLCVQWQPVPASFHATLVNTDNQEQEMFSGVVHVSDIDNLGFSLFEEVLKSIESIQQDYMPVRQAASLKVPDSPLFVMTGVELDDENKLRLIMDGMTYKVFTPIGLFKV